MTTKNDECARWNSASEFWRASRNNSLGVDNQCLLVCERQIVNTNAWEIAETRVMSLVRDGTDCNPRDRHRVSLQGQCQVMDRTGVFDNIT